MDKLSVIIRVKNEEHWIGHAIQSILDHTNEPEIVIVDNNSSDESIDIIKHFIRDPVLKSGDPTKYTEVKILKINDYSPGKAINLGVKNATNENCLIMSAHCVLNLFNFEEMCNNLKNHVCVFGKQIPVWNGKKITPRYVWSHFIDNKEVNMYSNLEKRYFLHNAIAAYKRDFLIENPFDEVLQSKEDRYWVNEMIEKNYKILYDPLIEVFHHYTPNGNTWKGLR